MGGGGGEGIATPSTLILFNFIAKTVGPIQKIFWWASSQG